MGVKKSGKFPIVGLMSEANPHLQILEVRSIQILISINFIRPKNNTWVPGV
jgi:hypothetical protein